MNLVKVIKTAVSKIKHEIFNDDIAEDRIFSVVECVPIPGQKVLKLTLDGGDTIIIPGEILDTTLKPGEKKLKATNEAGEEQISITVYDDGTIQIQGGTQEMVAVLSSALGNISDGVDNTKIWVDAIAAVVIPPTGGAPSGLKGIMTPTVYDPLKLAVTTSKNAIDTDKTNLDTLKK